MAKKNKKVKKPNLRHVGKNITLDVVQLYRKAPDIGIWRSALRQAENINNPDRLRLLEVYREIDLDPHLTSVTDRIVKRCTNTPIQFVKNGEVDDAHPLNELAGKPYFLDLIGYILESVWWGFSLIQLNFLEKSFDEDMTEGIEVVPRQHVRPEYRDIIIHRGDAYGIDYGKPPYSNFLLFSGKRFDLGLLNKAVSSVLYKRYGVKDWAEFLEVYGLPIKEIQYDPNMPGQRKEAEKSLEQQGSNAGVIIPKGSDFRLHDTAKAGNSDAFKDNAEFHNKEMSKLFLLQTMTTEDGSSKSQSETHQKAEDEAILSYKIFVLNILNHKLNKILAKHGFDTDGVWKYSDSEKLTRIQLADLLVKLKNLGFVPRAEWISEQFGIPLQEVENELRAVKKKALILSIPQYPQSDCSNCDTLQLTGRDELDEAERSLLRKVWEGMKGAIDRATFFATVKTLINGITKGWNPPDYNAPDYLEISLMEANIFRFSAAKNMATVQRLNEMLLESENFSDFKIKASTLLKQFNENYLRTEYNFAIAVSQNARNYLEQQADKDIFPYWEYQTVGDARVRTAHQRLDGRIFTLDSKASDQFYPPNGWGCRCEAIAKSDRDGKKVTTLTQAVAAVGEEYDKMKKGHFNINRAKLGVVFLENQFYLKHFKSNSLDFQGFERPAYKAMKGLTKLDTSYQTKDVRKWFDDRIGQNGLNDHDKIRLVDYAGRPIILEKRIVNRLIRNKKAGLLKHIETLFKKPDEAWLTQTKNGYNITFINFHDGHSMKTTIEYGKGKSHNITSIDLSKSIDKDRKGVLTKIK